MNSPRSLAHLMTTLVEETERLSDLVDSYQIAIEAAQIAYGANDNPSTITDEARAIQKKLDRYELPLQEINNRLNDARRAAEEMARDPKAIAFLTTYADHHLNRR